MGVPVCYRGGRRDSPSSPRHPPRLAEDRQGRRGKLTRHLLVAAAQLLVGVARRWSATAPSQVKLCLGSDG